MPVGDLKSKAHTEFRVRGDFYSPTSQELNSRFSEALKRVVGFRQVVEAVKRRGLSLVRYNSRSEFPSN